MVRHALVRAAGPLSVVAAALLAAAAAFRLGGRTVRWSSAAIAFTPAVATGGAALGAVAAALGHRRPAAVLGVASAVLGATVVPRTRAATQPAVEEAGSMTFTILSANCLKGRADAGALVALVREVRPDVLALQEQNPRFMRRLDDAGLAELLPNRVLGAGNRRADAGLASRHPLTAIAPELPSEFAAARATLPDGREVPLISFHPLPPVGRAATAAWLAGLAAMPAPSGPFGGGVVCGDFNATLDHPEFRALLGLGWRDAGAECGHGLRATWSEFGLLRLTIDHILVPPGARAEGFRVHRLQGSDHRAISVVLTLPG